MAGNYAYSFGDFSPGIIEIIDISPYCDTYLGIDPTTGQVVEKNIEPNIQTLNLTDETLSITDGNSVDLSGLDHQTLSLSGTNLSISNGNTIDLKRLIPAGTIQMYYGNSAPAGWLVCDSSTFDAATYPDLYAILGGNTLPDFRGRFPGNRQ
ncbi:MAG: tail fiber protein [Lewinellaceae bacterium]|nr:tail fiber protein [Lewinellaceae bacterium]